MYVEGRIKTRKWQDKDGQDRHITEIEATDMKMLGGRQPDKQPSTPLSQEIRDDEGRIGSTIPPDWMKGDPYPF